MTNEYRTCQSILRICATARRRVFGVRAGTNKWLASGLACTHSYTRIRTELDKVAGLSCADIYVKFRASISLREALGKRGVYKTGAEYRTRLFRMWQLLRFNEVWLRM